MLPNNVSVAVKDKGVRDHIHVHGTLEVTILIQNDLILPVVAVGKRFYLGARPGVVDRNSDQLYAGFFLPVIVLISNGVQLLDTRLAPECPEAQDDGLAIIFNIGSAKWFSFCCLQVD